MTEFWVRERGSNPEAWCPIEFNGSHFEVVTGLTLVGDPLGKKWGEFWFSDDGFIRIKSFADEYEPR